MRSSELKQQQPLARKPAKAEEQSASISEQLPRNKSSNILNSSTDSFYNNIFPRPKRELPGKGLSQVNQNRSSHEKHKSLHQQVLNATCQHDNTIALNQTGQLITQVQAQTLQRRSTASSYEPSHQTKNSQILKPFQQDYSLIQSNKSGFKQSQDQQRNTEQSDSVEQYLCSSPLASKQKLLSKEQQQQQQQQQHRQHPSQQGKNALNLKNLVSQAIPSASSSQQYMRKSGGIGKQRQNYQCYSQIQSPATTQQSQSMADCNSSHAAVNQSLPCNYLEMQKRNNANISCIIQQDNTGVDATLHTLELPTEPQLTNTSSVIPPELGQLSQLDILQIENSILTRNILTNIHQQQQKQQCFQSPQQQHQQQQQPFFGSTTNSTNNSSIAFDKNIQVAGVYSSLPNSPRSSSGYHHAIGQAISSINNNNNNNSCSDEKFSEIQNQLKAIEKQLKQQNRIQEKSQQQQSNNSINSNNISKLAAHQQQQQQHQVLVSNLNKRAYLLEQAIQRKSKQPQSSEIASEKQDYSIEISGSSQASLESQLKELQQSVRISQQENEKLSTEATKFKLEIARLEGIIAQKESFQLEREKQNEIIYAQQKIMLSNYEAIKLQSEDIQANRQSLLMDLTNKEKENQMLKQEIQEKDEKIAMLNKEMNKKQLLEQQIGSRMNNQEDNGELSSLVKQLEEQIQRLNEDIKQKDAEIRCKTAEITKKDTLLLQANESTEKLQCQIKELEQTKSSEGIEQQKMKQQIYISEATILLLNQEIESYKTELVQVQQLCSISQAPSKYIMNSNAAGVGKQRGIAAGKITETEKQSEQVGQQQQLPQIHDEYQKLQVNYQELKVKEVEYEKSIKDLKAVFEEENTVRKSLETELTQLKSAFSVQKNFSTNVGSASKVVQDLILKQKKENALDLSNGQTSSIDEEISLYKDIIQGLTAQLNELQEQNKLEKKQYQEEYKRLRAEKDQKVNEINKLIKEITKLKKELEFSEIKETLNDREEEMTQLRNRNEELIATYQAGQEKRAKDRQQLEKDNEEYITILKKNYESQLDKLKKEQRGGGDDEKIRMKERKLEEELETCKRLYAKIITEDIAQVKLIGKMSDAVNSKKKENTITNIEQDQRVIREKQESVDVAGVVERYQNSISGCSSLSMILKNSLRFNDIKKELLRSVFGKIDEEGYENTGMEEVVVEDLEAKNKLAESVLSLSAQQNHLVLQGEYTSHQTENSSKTNDNMKLLDSIVAEFAANNSSNNNLSDSIVKLSSNAIENVHGHTSLFQQDGGNILNKTKLETVLESGESGLRPDTTPSQENSLQRSLKCSFTRSASPRDERNVADLQRQLEEVCSKLVKVQRELMERQTEQEGLLMMATAEAARKKVLEDKMKMIQEELEKSEKSRKDLVDINKKLQQKIAQNESVKEFFEEQLKEQKNIIEQLEKETKLKASQFKMCSSGNNLIGSIGGSAGLQMDSSLKNSLISSSIGGDSVIDVDKLLSELQDRINENGELQQAKEQLEQKLDQAQKELAGSKEQIDDLQMEIEVLRNQLATKNAENKSLKQEIQQLEQMRAANRQGNNFNANNLLKIDNILSDPSHIISNLPIQESIERHVDLQMSESFLNRENMQFLEGKDSKISGGMKSSPEDHSEDSKQGDSQDKKELDVLQELKAMVKNLKE